MNGPAPRASEALPVASPRTTLRAVTRAALAHRGLLASSAVTAVLASLATTATPVLLGRVVDTVVALRADDGAASALVGLTTAIAAAVLLTAVVSALALRQVERLGAAIAADLREACVETSMRMEPARFERAGAGDVTTRVTEDVELFTLSVPLLAHVVTSLITVAVALAGFVSLDWRLGLAFLVVVPVYAAGLRYYLPKAGPLYRTERARASERSRVLLESIHGRRTVHAYRMAPLQSDRVAATSASALESGVAAQTLGMRFALTMNIAEGVGLAAVLACGFLLVRADATTVGDVTAAALLFHRLFGPLGTLLLSIDQVQRAAAALTRIVGIAGIDDGRDVDGPSTRAAVTDRADGAGPGRVGPVGPVAVRVRAVRHSYSAGHEVLHGVDLEIPAGSTLAVVGESGAGKTTLAAIVAGVVPPTEGGVELELGSSGGGAVCTVGVGDLDADRLRDVVAMVSQESHVFAGTLREDLLLARPGSGDERLWSVLEQIGAATWVRALPGGLDTVVGAGGHPLTAAQEQHLALVRVALRDAPLVVLDEATAEANSAGSRDLESAAAKLLAGRTALVVAHRLTQARACDRIAVMHEGAVVELGAHDELLATGGLYSRLWAAWSGGDA